MIKVTTTKATYRGVEIVVLSENKGHGTKYSCNNNSGQPKVVEKWFPSQREALANEKSVIDTLLG